MRQYVSNFHCRENHDTLDKANKTKLTDQEIDDFIEIRVKQAIRMLHDTGEISFYERVLMNVGTNSVTRDHYKGIMIVKKSQENWYENIFSRLDALKIQMKKMKHNQMELNKLEANYQKMMNPFH